MTMELTSEAAATFETQAFHAVVAALAKRRAAAGPECGHICDAPPRFGYQFYGEYHCELEPGHGGDHAMDYGRGMIATWEQE